MFSRGTYYSSTISGICANNDIIGCCQVERGPTTSGVEVMIFFCLIIAQAHTGMSAGYVRIFCIFLIYRYIVETITKGLPVSCVTSGNADTLPLIVHCVMLNSHPIVTHERHTGRMRRPPELDQAIFAMTDTNRPRLRDILSFW